MKQILMAIAVVGVSAAGYQAQAEEVASPGLEMTQGSVALAVQTSAASEDSPAPQLAKAPPSKTGNFWTGDAKLVVVDRYSGAAALPKPARVVIADFPLPADDITIDHSLSARLHRRLMAHFGKDDDSSPEILAQHVQSAFFDGLSAELKKVNVPSDRAAGSADDAAPSELIVSGQFTALDEGNKTKRELIGLGRGASDIKTHVTITSVTAGRSTVVLEFDMTAESNKKPGALITSSASLGVGAAEKAVGDRKSTVEADATRMGKLVAKQVEGLATEQKWVYSPPVVTAKSTSSSTPAG